MRAAVLVTLCALLLASGAAAQQAVPSQLDPARTTLEVEGRDRGKPRPVALTLGLTRAVPHRVAIIDHPPRLVVDLQDTAVPASGTTDPDRPLALRWGPAPQGGARAILTLPGPMAVDTAQMQPAPPALAVRLVPVPIDAFVPRRDSLTVLHGLPHPAEVGRGRAGTALADGRIRVVIDPGHGGIDPGAQAGAISEAAVMLGFARELAAALQSRGIEVALTRADDRFVPLERRTTVARAQAADLFISLHADALPAGEAAGATIYTWDPKSNDRAARQLATLHDRSDMLAGVDLTATDEDVSRALIDLARIDTQPRSQAAARHLVAQLGQAAVAMHRRPVRGAAFSVLKSPDIPSLLIELGFLTDPDDRANLFDPDWRARVAGAIARGVSSWAEDEAARAGIARPAPDAPPKPGPTAAR